VVRANQQAKCHQELARRIAQARIDRAERLSSQYDFAREVLEFYAQVAPFQKSLHANIASSADQESSGGFEAAARGAIELSVLLPH
jgi:hypothetical protein